ncbi:MAG: hypothetical protein SFW62_01135 [Alphaproteobacteria bacterium]|nr:hypothetical protein [Alphaproteobacteria bacterium]
MKKNLHLSLMYGMALAFGAAHLQALPAVAEQMPPQISGTSPSSQILGTISGADVVVVASGEDDSTVLQPRQFGSITYITGGVGDEERSALEAMQKDYNLRVMMSSTTGHFMTDTRLVIRSRDGKELLDVVTGPLFSAKLPEGAYTVEAFNEGQGKKQNITITRRESSRLHFSW